MSAATRPAGQPLLIHADRATRSTAMIAALAALTIAGGSPATPEANAPATSADLSAEF
jgi:hypothetical protein